MKTLTLLLLALSAAAQEGGPISATPPPAEVHEAAKEAGAAVAEKVEALKPEPAPAPEEPKVEAPKPEPAPAPVVVKAAAKGPGTDEEFAFAKSAAEDADGSVQEAAMAELSVFVRRHAGSVQAPEAMLLLAGLKAKAGDWQPAMAALLRLLYEYPGTKTGLRAKSDYMTLVDKKASRKHRQALNDLVKLPETSDKADRLSALWRTIVEQAPDALYEPVAAEIQEFTVRFPSHKDGDKLQAALARLHGENGKSAAAMLSWRKLLTLFPSSPLCPAAQMAVGDLYADKLRDPKKAIDAYQELVEKYPSASEVQPALERSASLFDEKLRQYALAVEMHEKVAATFSKTPASLKALKEIARLQRDRLGSPGDALKTWMRLSSMHGAPDGVEALLKAADIARRDLKDFARQAEILRKVADDYAAAKEAPQALIDAAGVYESDLKDNPKAIEVYRETASKFSSHRLAKKAEDRATKLEAK